MDDLGKLLLFRDIVDHGGFSPAARHRKLSHSTVSKHLKTLESVLGVSLLQRTSRSMMLTEEGRMVYDYSKRVGVHIDELMARIEEHRAEVQGELHISSLVHVGRHIVQPAIASFLNEFPQARVCLTLDDGPLHFTRDGIDIAIRVGRDVEESLSAKKLVDNPVCLAASPSFIKKHGLPKHPCELSHFPTVAYITQAIDITVWTYRENGEYLTVEIHPVYSVNEGNALLDGVRAGVGIGYLSTFAAQEDLSTGSIQKILPEFELPSYESVYMIQERSDYRTPKLEAFKKHLTITASNIGASL